MTAAHADSILLYDGQCGFCDRTVQFILVRDRNRTLQFAPLQGEFAAKLFIRFPHLREIDSLVFVQRASPTMPERALVRSDAVLATADYLGGLWRVAGFALRVVPRGLRDMAYDAFAKRRFRVFGRLDACRIPSAGERARFLD